MTARFLTRATAAAVIALALGAAPAAHAQNVPEQPGAQPMQPGQAPAASHRMERVERHITDLHHRLQITAQEEPQWTAFAQVMRENAERMDQAFAARRARGQGMNAVDDLRSYAAIAERHAQDMQRLVPAFEALYSAMPPAQQKLADRVFHDFEHRPHRR